MLPSVLNWSRYMKRLVNFLKEIINYACNIEQTGIE